MQPIDRGGAGVLLGPGVRHCLRLLALTILGFTLICVQPTAGRAQQHAPALEAWVAPALAPAEPLAALRVAEARGNHRWTGAVLGAVVLGGLGVWLGSRKSEACTLSVPGSCSTSYPLGGPVLLGVGGAVLGGTLGYLFGASTPR
jgi:hypothetical protein